MSGFPIDMSIGDAFGLMKRRPFASPVGMIDRHTTHGYWAIVVGALFSLIQGVVLTLCAAPLASACRQLADGAGPSAGEAPATTV